MEGAQGTLYEDEQFQLQFKFSPKYPFDSPEVRISGNKYIILVIFNLNEIYLYLYLYEYLEVRKIKVLSISSIYIKLKFCLYICPNHATFWLHTFQTKL